MEHYSPSRTLVEMYKEEYALQAYSLMKNQMVILDLYFWESRMEQSFTIKIHFTALVFILFI